ncbi:MAG: tetratricopeptide repeat protein [Gammaproteobacteria bacterium]|nr:tetratricopeptide repeat protein [Gammaproteobacteria bacterium]
MTIIKIMRTEKAQAASKSSIRNILQAAAIHQQAGRLPQAEVLYQQVLQLEPDNADVLHSLGMVAGQSGRNERALDFINKAIAIRPAEAAYHNSMGIICNELGRLDEAVASYRKAIELKPDYAGAYYNMGNALRTQKKLEDAVACYRKAILFRPDHVSAYNNLGNVQQEQGKLDEAITTLRKALLLMPEQPGTHFNLGSALQARGALDAAIENYRHALALNPTYAEAHFNLGLVRKIQGNIEEAVSSYRQALAIKPDYVAAHNNLGMALKDQGKLDEAIASYRRALAIRPDYIDAYNNLLFVYSYNSMLAPSEYLVRARGWELACVSEQERREARSRKFERLPLSGRRLRVGYVSGDFRHHAVSNFIERLCMHHDRERVELFAYSTNARRDAVTDRLQALVDHWIPVAGMSAAAIRERIEADGIDVLVDLSGHTGHNRMGVFALRAAPVQMHYLGYCASTGLSEMDYFIGDEILTPPEMDSHFSERVWRLPRICVSYAGKADAPVADWHPAQDGTLWVGSFNSLNKLTPATLLLWSRVLHALPEGKLLLKAKELADAGNCQRILEVMAGHGISASRIELQSSNITPGWKEHMAYYDRLDVALDPVGAMGGETTTCDALWMGVPVIVLEGDRRASRMSTSMLNAIGHPEWVAKTEVEYIDKTIALARNVALCKALRTNQRARMSASPLCDAQGLATCLEDAYIAMIERWQNTQQS